jgi:hypothetical protein
MISVGSARAKMRCVPNVLVPCEERNTMEVFLEARPE